MKVFDLTGVASEKFDDPKIKNYSGVAREILRENNVCYSLLIYNFFGYF